MSISFGTFSSKKHSLNEIASLINEKISSSALHYKFNEKAVAFMSVCTQKFLKEKIENTNKIKNKLLNQFNKILILDATSFDISSKLRAVLPGSGGAASKANCKIQVIYEYLSGTLDFFEITPGNKPDNKFANELPQQIIKNNLYLFDLGYFNFLVFNKIIEISAFFLCRYRTGTILFNLETGKEINFTNELNKTIGDIYEREVIVGREKNKQFECRLVALRVPKNIADERRRKAHREAKKKGRSASKEKLALCDWIIFITNVTKEMAPAETLHSLYKLRWQIELIFKQFKSLLHLHISDTGNIHRLRCEIYGKLIVAIFIHQIHGYYNGKYWNEKKREISMDKLYKLLQPKGIVILEKIIVSISSAIKYLKQTLKKIINRCMKGKQNSKSTTLKTLDSLSSSYF